jgi:phage terminase small subunit
MPEAAPAIRNPHFRAPTILPPMTTENLTDRQKRFVAAYLESLNGTRAAIRAGWSPQSAERAAWENLRYPAVAAAIAEAQAPRFEALKMRAEDVLRELAAIARANILDYVRIGENGEPVFKPAGLDRGKAAALRASALSIDGTRVRVRIYDKIAALDRLARHYGLLRRQVAYATREGAVPPPQDFLAEDRHPPATGLTGRQKLFVAEYLIDLNGKQAAIRAGFSPRTATEIACKTLSRPAVAAALAREQAKRFAAIDFSADDVLRELAAIAYGNILDYVRIGESGNPVVDLSGLDRTRAAALAEVAVDGGAGHQRIRPRGR